MWQDNVVDGDYSTPSMFPIDPKKELPEVGEVVLAVIDPNIDKQTRFLNLYVLSTVSPKSGAIYTDMVVFVGFDEENYPVFKKTSAGFMNTGYVDDQTIVCYYKLPKVTRNTSYNED